MHYCLIQELNLNNSVTSYIETYVLIVKVLEIKVYTLNIRDFKPEQ